MEAASKAQATSKTATNSDMNWLRPSNSTPYSSCLSLSPKTRESAVATPRTRSYLENIVCYFVILKQSFILET